MKLIVAIIQDHVVQAVIDELANNEIRATKLASTGGFFRKGSSTFLVGVEDEKVPMVKEMILNISKSQDKYDEKTSNVVMFVLNTNKFVRM